VTRPLVVSATRAEAAHVPDGVDVVICGIGKVDAAVATTRAILERRPSSVINLGTAGALRPYTEGLFVPSAVLNHDLSADVLRGLGHPAVDRIDISDGDGTVLATGDVFVTDPVVRDVLAERATLVDMEGFAIAAACRALHVPFRLVKHVSDPADETALDWPVLVDASARVLGRWVTDHL